MKFELTNKQRDYLGLDPIPTTWDKEILKADTYRPDSIIYFDGNTLKRHIVSTDSNYKETQYNELTKDRKVLLPKTDNGKEAFINCTHIRGVVKNGSSFEYQYAISDHQVNKK